MKGWECPKCGRVYAPNITECRNCNSVDIPKWEYDTLTYKPRYHRWWHQYPAVLCNT